MLRPHPTPHSPADRPPADVFFCMLEIIYRGACRSSNSSVLPRHLNNSRFKALQQALTPGLFLRLRLRHTSPKVATEGGVKDFSWLKFLNIFQTRA